MSLAKNDDATHSERRKTFERRAWGVGSVPDAEHAVEDHSDYVQLVRAIKLVRRSEIIRLDTIFSISFQVRQRHGVYWTELLRSIVGTKSVLELSAVVCRGSA